MNNGGKEMKNILWLTPLMVLFLMFLSIPHAFAHVTVHPSESSTNAWEKYSVRIPVEKDSNTVKVALDIPEGINFVSVMPTEGWKYEFEKDDNENINQVTWTAIEDGIKPYEFIEFYFVASNPDEPGEFSWDAYQTYADDSVVEWTGEPDSDEPASITEVVEGNASSQHEYSDDNVNDEKKNGQNHISNEDSNNNWMAISIAIVAILLALIGIFRKRH